MIWKVLGFKYDASAHERKTEFYFNRVSIGELQSRNKITISQKQIRTVTVG